MENYFKFILYPHIVAGFLALVVAPIAMVVKKGGKSHRLWGKIFFYSMCVVGLSSFAMAIIKSNIFLGMVGGFSLYLVISGYRALYRRHVNSFKEVASVDWILLFFSALFCIALIVLGILVLKSNLSQPFGYVSLVFGFIGCRSVLNDVLKFRIKDHHKENWMYHHMGGMVGAYIATVSAFSAVNLHFLPAAIQWLWPTVIGVPLLFYWISKYKYAKKLKTQN